MSVTTGFLPQQSDAHQGRYAFAYTVTIDNMSERTVQLKSRHWVIEHADDKTEEVKGPGVVGKEPVLKSGQSFQYTSGCVLCRTWGTMHGSYQMKTEAGDSFDVEIPAFLLAAPFAVPADSNEKEASP